MSANSHPCARACLEDCLWRKKHTEELLLGCPALVTVTTDMGLFPLHSMLGQHPRPTPGSWLWHCQHIHTIYSHGREGKPYLCGKLWTGTGFWGVLQEPWAEFAAGSGGSPGSTDVMDSQSQSQVPMYWDCAEDTGATFTCWRDTSKCQWPPQPWSLHSRAGTSTQHKPRSILRAWGFAAHTDLSLLVPPSPSATHQHHSMISQAVAHPGCGSSWLC